MEARSIAKANQHKSDEIAEDVRKFQERGGKIQVLPTRPDVMVSLPLESQYSMSKKQAAKKAKAETIEDEYVDDSDVIPISHETPAEQIDTRIE